MQLNEIKVNRELMELTQHETPDLPMQVYIDEFAKYVLRYVNWHWHSQLEFAVVTHGRARFRVNEACVELAEGEGIFVNSNILHMAEAVGRPEDTAMFSILFNPKMIASSEQGVIFTKYVLPILTCHELACFRLAVDVAWQREILELLREIQVMDRERDYGYELEYHNRLCAVWSLMVRNLQDCYRNTNKRVDSRKRMQQERLNTMLDFIKLHFSEDITVADIAGAANISKSECYRCFESTMGVKPHDFFVKFRVEQAMALLAGSDLTVTKIGTLCGFNSASHFSQSFKRYTGLNPMEYRMGCSAGDAGGPAK